MAFEESSGRLTCPSCGAEHEAKWSRMPVRERATLRCQACRSVLYEGSTVRDYYQVTLL